MYLQLSIHKVLNKSFDARGCYVSIWWLVLGHFLRQLDETNSWNFLFLETKELQNTAILFIACIKIDEQHLNKKNLEESAEIQILVNSLKHQ